jgi:erythritol transport system substrate-binding protein
MFKTTRRKLVTALLLTPLMAGSVWAQGKGTMTIIVNDPANPYWYTEGKVAKAAAEKLGYTAVVTSHSGDAASEAKLVDKAIASKSVAIILDPANSAGSLAAIEKAVAANIPVFIVNAEINKEGLAKAQLVSNNAQGAALGARYWAEAVGEAGKYVELLGAPSDNNAAIRSNGYKSVLSKKATLVKAGSAVANWERTEGYVKSQSLLKANADIKGVIAGNDEMALGAIAALKEAGKLKGVIVGGFDGSPDAVAAIKEGELAYTVLQPVAVFSAAAVQQADSFIRTGKTGAKSEKQLFDCLLITKSNVAKYSAPFVLEK